MPASSVDPDLESAVDEVRAYLVTVRGGAPFLSGRDAQLLVAWLDAGVTVPAILSAVDRVAARRRKNRSVRTRLTLAQVRSELERSPKRPPPPPSKPSAAPKGLPALATRVATMEVPLVLADARRSLSRELLEIDARVDDRDQQAQEAMAACRRFQEVAWEQCIDLQEEIRAAVEGDLADLKSALGPAGFERAVEEVVRDRLRMRFPAVSAQAVWDTLTT